MMANNLDTPKKTIQVIKSLPLFLLLLFACSVAVAQTSESTASVSGRVTVDGRGVAGITVVARISTSQWQEQTIAKTVTGDDGNYRLTRLSPGRVTIAPVAKSHIASTSGKYAEPEQSVNVTEGESITKIDFVLVKGGVITGRITDMDGRPIIGERIDLIVDNGSGTGAERTIFPQSRNQTDDRGVYRFYGLGPGAYKVSVGRLTAADGGSNSMDNSLYIRTFYPGVVDPSKATPLEISEGTEVANIDITPGRFARGYSASGSVIYADSNKPVTNVYVAYSDVNQVNQSLGRMNFTGSQTDANGRFHLEGIEPGHYTAFMLTAGQENFFSDTTPFDITSGDVAGIEIKVRRGGTIDGVAVIENNLEPANTPLFQSVILYASVSNPNGTSPPSFSQSKINPDGSFHFAGLAPGVARIHVTGFPDPPKGLELVRTEVQGQVQPNGIDLTAGEHITGVRLVFTYGTGKIRGELKVDGREWPADLDIVLYIHASGGTSQYSRSIQVDARGHFSLENIPPGNYQLTLRSASNTPEFETIERNITISNGVELPITIVIDHLN